MKKISFLLSTLSLCIVIPNLMAQNVNDKTSFGVDVNPLKYGGEVPGFFSSSPGTDLLKNATINADGTKTIKAGQQTPEANELNRRFCESFGARDVTNEIDLTIGSGTVYAGVCLGSDGRRLSTKAQPIPGIGTGRVFLPIPDENTEPKSSFKLSTRAPMNIVAYASNGSTPFNQMYYATGYADFFNLPSTNQGSAVGTVHENAPCSWTISGAIGPGYEVLSGFAACIPSKAAAPSTLTACFAGSCSTGHGMITHY